MSEIKATSMPDPELCIKAYSGRPGCMCGCLGDYKHFGNIDEIKSAMRIYRKISRSINSGDVITSENSFSGENYVFLHDFSSSQRGRYYAVYFKEKKVK
jgi:Fe-S-cluster-containing dehydrogenase component